MTATMLRTGMHMGTMKKLFQLTAALCAVLAPAATFAQTFPSKPVLFVMPNAPGAVADYVAHIVAARISAETKQPVIVEPKAGGGGNIGAEVVAKAAPDGYTLLLGFPGTHSVNIHMFKSLAYDPVKDFAPISLLMKAPYYLFVGASLPVNSVADLVSYAKANPGKMNFGSSGNGGPSHLAIVLFNMMASVELFHIPYRGAAGAMTDMLGGRIQGQFTTATAAMPHVKAGQIRVIGVSYQHRTADFPDVPAISESVPGYELTTWQGLLAPAKTPKNRIDQLNQLVRKVLAEPDVKARFREAGLDTAATSPKEFADWIASETTKMGRLIKAAGIKPE